MTFSCHANPQLQGLMKERADMHALSIIETYLAHRMHNAATAVPDAEIGDSRRASTPPTVAACEERMAFFWRYTRQGQWPRPCGRPLPGRQAGPIKALESLLKMFLFRLQNKMNRAKIK